MLRKASKDQYTFRSSEPIEIGIVVPKMSYKCNLFLKCCFCLVFVASSLLVVACDKEEASRSEFRESVEIFFRESYGMEWSELSALIELLARSGHFRISVNDSEIKLPPKVPIFESVPEAERLAVHVGIQKEANGVQNQFDPRSLGHLRDFLDKEQPLQLVSLSFDDDLQVNDVIAVFRLFNSRGIDFYLVRSGRAGN